MDLTKVFRRLSFTMKAKFNNSRKKKVLTHVECRYLILRILSNLIPDAAKIRISVQLE